MTTESQKAFEEWLFPSPASADVNRDENGNYTWNKASYAWEGWQASEARIRAMLESEAMVNIVDTEIQATLFQTHGYCSSEDMAEAAKAALKAIAEEI